MSKTSPVKSISKPFGITQVINLNLFIPLGKAAHGRYHFALFTQTTLDFETLVLIPDTQKKYSSDCYQYLIKSVENKVIGSFFEVNYKKLKFSQNTCTIVDSECDSDFVLLEDSLEGTCCFSDQEGSFLFVPSSPNINRFTVK